jgi:hypothetical protein
MNRKGAEAQREKEREKRETISAKKSESKEHNLTMTRKAQKIPRKDRKARQVSARFLWALAS